MAWTKAPERERREQILTAALAVAARDGLARLTLRSVATEAGLSHGSVILHFGSKDALLAGLLDVVLDWLLDPATLGGPVARAGAADFVGVLRREVAAADRDRTAVLLDFWVIGTRTPALRERLRQAITSYETRLATTAAHDDLRLTDEADRAGLAALATTVVFGTALRDLLDPSPSPSPHHAAERADPLTVLQRLLRP